MKRFITRNELRDEKYGWSLTKEDTSFIYKHEQTQAKITIDMLKSLQGKSAEDCLVEFPQYTYTDEMFIAMNEESVLKKIMTNDEYRNYLKGVVIEETYNNNFQKALEKLNELSGLSN